MGRIKMKILLSPLLLFFINFGNAALPAKIAVDEWRGRFIELDKQVWSVIKEEHRNDIEHFKSQANSIAKYREFIEGFDDVFKTQFNEGLRPFQYYRLWMTLYAEMRPIYTAFDTFKKVLNSENGIPSPKEQRLEYSQAVLTDFGNYKYLKNTVPSTMKLIHNFVKNDNIFKNALNFISYDGCKLPQSTQQLIYNLYNSIALIELKGYIITQFANTMLTVYGKGYRDHGHTIALNDFDEFHNETTQHAKDALALTNQEIWKCDPKIHVKDETYTELTQLLQGYLENEVDMNPRSNCLQNCAYYEYTKNVGCFSDLCKRQRVCKGKIVNCQYVKSDMTICEADKKSGRRYEYIEYDNDRVFGRNMGCTRGTTRVESWWRWLFWHCSYCICLCDEETTQSDRYFSLRPVVSNTANNMVVTGLRFRKVDQIIHLQIQESKLEPYGVVNASVSRWKPIDKFKISDKNVHETEDYHKMLFESRDIDLDDLFLDKNYIVTGVKFRIIGTHLNLEIQATPFNFTTGVLIQSDIKSFWHSSDATLTRTQLKLKNSDVPTRSPLQSRQDSQTNMYLEFTNSDLDRDVGQNTVPFFDIQDVASEYLVPLSGVGIYHKGQPNFGGFVAPKIFTYNYSKHIGN